MKHLSVGLLTFMLLLVSSCGFQLRGTGAPELAVERVSVTGSAQELMDELSQTLKTIGVVVGQAEPEYVIDLINERVNRRAVASSGSITVSEYEVRVVAVFSVVAENGELLIPASELVSERVYSFDPNNFVSNTEEESLLIEEMRQDIAGQLVRRFSATLRNRPGLSSTGATAGE